ncbi:MAG: hypothetical protein EHM58_03685 [Ignavibacteriae bacterium]|nr:MAG: hypothetical protein EHM58_03685 [Ignavibacteriota bacterium]
MSKLEVTAIVENTQTSSGNTSPTYLVVSVIDPNGAGVIGLNAANFTLCTEIVGNGGGYSHISAISSVNPGVYILRLLPLKGKTWKAGVYIYSIVVHHGVHRGQTLCKFSVN